MEKRIELEALITEREGMIAENKVRESLGHSLAYTYDCFSVLASQMRELKEKPADRPGGDDLDQIRAELEIDVDWQAKYYSLRSQIGEVADRVYNCIYERSLFPLHDIADKLDKLAKGE